jgi:nucleotide-binding universal stress UspA family protein
MYNVIVVGTDGSERASLAVEHAFGIAEMTGATLHVVHALGPSRSPEKLDDASSMAVTGVNARYDRGDVICAQVQAAARERELTCTMHSPVGDPADVLIRVATDEHAQLIVLGNRGMTGVKRFVLGSVPGKVSHRCPCALLIVNTDGT